MRRLGEAAACVAHQIKNSLQALSGLAHSATAAGSGQGPVQDAPRFQDALRNLGELVDDVLAVAGTTRPPVEEIPLRQAVSSALLLTRPGGARVTLDPCGQDLRVWTHRGQLVHALYNLLDNACRATPPGGTVHVRMDGEDSHARIEIIDEGPGLPPGVDEARGPVPSRAGAGLGLMAARRFLEASGGKLSFSAEPGGGTRCRVTLPVGAAPAARPDRGPVT